ncbi:MAG: stage II sporulation protein P [Acutalibacteraceae bacterium]|nr:stage II sporulation protein P [Acutalibacteraceae bacterium]
MKNHSEKDKLPEIITAVVAILLIATVVFTNSAGEVSLAAAKIMFNSGNKIQTHTVVMPDTLYSTSASTTQTEVEAMKASAKKDITQTPSDIVALIEKYTKLFKDDKKDGDIKSLTYTEKGATDIFENVCVKNTTETKSLDIKSILASPLELSINKSKPAVLIFHSHTSEGYEMIERNWYAQDYIARSNDESRNIVRVGTEIADYLTDAGYTVIHDKTIHDNSYNDSYPSSRKTVEKHLEEHPEIQIVLDIHRDSVTQNNGDKIKFTSEINGKKAAQLMIITGAQEGKVEDFPDWEYNLRFALQLQKKCETMFPGLMRPVLFSQRKYNMDMTRFSLLIEMGSEANTLEEACYSGRMLAVALASLMDEYIKE